MTKSLLKNTYVMKLIKKTLKDVSEGYILFEQGEEWKKLFFRCGKIVNASSSSREDYLGQYLISYGVISCKEFEEAYRTGEEDKSALEAIQKFSTPKILKQMMFEKVIDTIFIAARWPECKYEVFSGQQAEHQSIDVEISTKEIAKGLKKRVDEFRSILKVIPELGARPEVDTEKAETTKINNQKEIILNYLKAGKTITDILSIMAPHNYLLLKSFYQLNKMGIISKGKGAPLSRDNAIRLVNDSSICKADHKVVSCFIINEPIQAGAEAPGDDRFKREVSIYQKLYNEDPENSIYNNGFVKAKSCFIVDFYSSKLSPFSIISLNSEREKIPLKNDVDDEVFSLIESMGGKISLRDIIRALECRHEIDVLTSINKFLVHEVVKEVEPETMIDAIRLGRAESFDKLFKKDDVNRFFETDISINLTSSMVSVISGSVSEEIAQEVGRESTGGSPVSLHNYEMTYLMLASMLGNYEAAEFLIYHQANLDIDNGNGVTALMLALENKHDDIAMLLLDNRADVDARNSNGYSALMIAASKGFAHVVDYMIKLNVNVNRKTANGQTALHSALRFDHQEIVVSLIAAGIDLDSKDRDGHTPLYYAESEDTVELIKRGRGNSKRLKKKMEKKKEAILVYDSGILSDDSQGVSYFLVLSLFIFLLVASSLFNIYLIFSPGNQYGISSQAKDAMKHLGKEYCGKFKACNKKLPPHVLANCEQMGTDIVSAYFKNARKCDMKMIKDCGNCLKELKCKEFLDVDDSNMSEYCHECLNICKFNLE